jgi:hypothetical protein
LLNQTNPLQPNNVGTQGATAPVNGGGFDSGDQGPTFHGRSRVPAGETFSRNP